MVDEIREIIRKIARGEKLTKREKEKISKHSEREAKRTVEKAKKKKKTISQPSVSKPSISKPSKPSRRSGGGGGVSRPSEPKKKISVVYIDEKGRYEHMQEIDPEKWERIKKKYGWKELKRVEGRKILQSEVNKAISEDTGKIPLVGGGTLYYSKAKYEGKTPEEIVEEVNIKRAEESKVTIEKLKSGEKSVWVTPENKIIISGRHPPGGMSEKTAEERGFRRVSPENVEIKEGKIIASVPVGISKAPKEPLKEATPEEVVGALRGSIKLGKAKKEELIELTPEEYKGYEALLTREEEAKKELKKKEEELKRKKEEISREFEEMHPIAKGLVSVAVGFKNIPDIAELTYLKATGQEEKWREKRAEMLTEFKGLGKEIVEKPTKGVPKALAETFTEGASQLPLYAGLGKVVTPVVGGVMAKATQIGVKTGATAKGVVYGLGAVAVTVPLVDVTMEAIQGNMQNVVRKSAQYGTELGAFTLGAVSSQPLRVGLLGGKKFKLKFKPKKFKPTKAPKVKGEELPKTWARSPYWSDAETVHQNVVRQMKIIQKNALKPLESRELAEVVKVKFPKPLTKTTPVVPKTEHAFVIPKYAEVKPHQIPLDFGKTIKLKGAKIVGYDEAGRITLLKGKRLYYLEVAEIEHIHPDFVAYRIISVVKGKPKVVVKGFVKKSAIRKMGEVALEKMKVLSPEYVELRPTTKPKIKTLKDIVKDVDSHYSSISKGLSREGTSQKLRLKAPKTKKSLTEKLAVKTATKEKIRLKVKARPKTLTQRLYLHQKRMAKLQTQMKARQKLLSSLGITLDQLYKKGILPMQTQRYMVKLREKARTKEEIRRRGLLPLPILAQKPLQDITQIIDQQYSQVTRQITQQETITQPIQEQKPLLDTDVVAPAKPRVKKGRKGGGVGVPMLPFAGTGIELLDSQYRTVTKHIKHNIPRVEKLLEL